MRIPVRPGPELIRHVRRSAWFFGVVLLVAFAIGVVNAWSEGAGVLLLLLGGLATIPAIIAGLAIGIVDGVQLPLAPDGRGRRAVAVSATFLFAGTTALAILPVMWTGGHLGSLGRLALNRSHYDAIIAQARRDRRSASFEESGGVTYSVDPGPPVRVAFNPAGMLDNWSGIVFDPSGEMMQARGFDPVSGRFHAPDRITKLFGGDLVGCRRLWGDFYTCSFT